MGRLSGSFSWLARILKQDPLGVLALVARWYLGYVFVYACLHKIAYPVSFAVDIATYQILPLFLVNPTAIILPWLELAVGVLLIIGFKARGAGLLVFGMMVMFLIAVIIALAKGLDMSCGCFASQAAQNDDPISWVTVLRDAFWLLLALFVVLFDKLPLGLDLFLARSR